MLSTAFTSSPIATKTTPTLVCMKGFEGVNWVYTYLLEAIAVKGVEQKKDNLFLYLLNKDIMKHVKIWNILLSMACII